MFTREAVKQITTEFINALAQKGFNPTKAIVFGSYVKGTAHEHSDIDLAVWDSKFSGCLPIDIELFLDIKGKFHPLLEVHTFHADETVEDNPFIGEIEKTGIPLHQL